MSVNVLVLGGSGGIGSALVRCLAARNDVDVVHASYFTSELSEDKHPKVYWHKVDPKDEIQVRGLLELIGSIHWCINAVGMLHVMGMGPEKSLSRFNTDFFLENIKANTVPSLLLAKYLPAVFKGMKNPIFATVSAKVGSIEDNQLGGWVSYRASKAALNMALKTTAIEWRRTLPQAAVAALHPGTVDTHLSKPFQSNVPEGKLFSPELSAQYMLAVLDKITPAESGRFWSWDGSELPW